jgi:hypothetical protein
VRCRALHQRLIFLKTQSDCPMPICIPVESEAAPRISKEAIMTKIEKILASGSTHATVNRDPNVQRGLRDANSTYFRLEY